MVEGRSANHFELAFTEAEVLVDFGQCYDKQQEPLIHTRIIMTPISANTLLEMLQDLLRQYEAKVGRIGAKRA